jgi:hypothetical protein
VKNFLIIVALFMVGCSSTKCRNTKHVEEISAKLKDGQQLKNTFQVNDGKSINQKERIFVYKYDGALQCGLGHGIKAYIMEKELKDVAVFSRENKPDGLMHVQACGQPTGRANVYEILRSDLAKAKKIGFMLWRFN